MKKSLGNSKLSLPNHIQFDTVSPATKLLEKRRKMYEVHEAFEAQKEEFKKFFFFSFSSLSKSLPKKGRRLFLKLRKKQSEREIWRFKNN